MWKLTNGKGDEYILDEVRIEKSLGGFTCCEQPILLPTTVTAHVTRSVHYTFPYASGITLPKIKKVIFNDPATIVLWNDGTKTVVKCQAGDEYSKEQGLALCIAKKHLGNKSNFNNEFKRWINE